MDSPYKTAVEAGLSLIAKARPRVARLRGVYYEVEAEGKPLPPLRLDKEKGLGMLIDGQATGEYHRRMLERACLPLDTRCVGGRAWAVYRVYEDEREDDEPDQEEYDVDLKPRGEFRVRMQVRGAYLKATDERLPLRLCKEWRVTWENPLQESILLGSIGAPAYNQIPFKETPLRNQFADMISGGRMCVWSTWELAKLPAGACDKQVAMRVMFPDGGMVAPMAHNRMKGDTPLMGQFDKPKPGRDRRKVHKRLRLYRQRQGLLANEILAEEPGLLNNPKALRRKIEKLQKERKGIDMETGNVIQYM